MRSVLLLLLWLGLTLLFPPHWWIMGGIVFCFELLISKIAKLDQRYVVYVAGAATQRLLLSGRAPLPCF